MLFKRSRSSILGVFFVFSYFAVLANTFSYLKLIKFDGVGTFVFAVVVWLVYGVVYLLPAAGATGLAGLVFGRGGAARFLGQGWSKTAIYCAAVFAAAAVNILLFADGMIFKMFGFHINGFVWNLITTTGGIDSMGGDVDTSVTFGLILSGIVVGQAGLMILSGTEFAGNWAERLFNKKRAIILAFAAGIIFMGQAVVYGVSKIYFYSPILTAGAVMPFYTPVTFTRLAQKFGVKLPRSDEVELKENLSRLHYPLGPLVVDKQCRKYNVVWLTAESLRADMVEPNIMPATYAFAKRSIWCRNNYSGGNGTRMGLFSLFYGLYGNYWFSFLNEQRGPVLVDALIEQNYQMDLYTSAMFSYPEFDKTIFAKVGSDKLHSYVKGLSWERDRRNVGEILNFMDKRETDRPFMTFMFFESPHAPYNFPPENAIAKPYLEEMNYATIDLERQIGLIKNRYINSCNHLDGQIARVLGYLEDHKLLDSTIVVIAGDHGEEFMEHGRWGHNSTFVKQQVQAPLIMWIPGEGAREITTITSHADAPGTLGKFLGIKNNVRDYSLGRDLLDGGAGESFAVINSWDQTVCVDSDYKAVFAMNAARFGGQMITNCNDEKISDTGAFYKSRKGELAAIMKGLGAFRAKKGK